MLETIERLKLRSSIVRIRGVLNSTCNFILDRCAAGDSLEEAIAVAQAQGFAESLPDEDLSGRDSARKIKILGSVAFGSEPVCEELTGVETALRLIKGAAGNGVRLVAEAERQESGFVYRVRPEVLPVDDFLAGTPGVGNRLEVWARDGTLVRISGVGAGGVPTATAVFADLLEHARVMDTDPERAISRGETVQTVTA